MNGNILMFIAANFQCKAQKIDLNHSSTL